MMKHIPNFITSLNLTSGFIAIIFAVNGNLNTASWLIIAAMIFDFFDGFSARILKAYSPLGKELDSLADVVSFGVAPGLIIFQMLCNSLGISNISTYPLHFKTIVILVIPAVMPVFAALRLAIFNLDETQSTTFKGLPTPANALAVVSLVIANHHTSSFFFTGLIQSLPFLIILTLALSLLMVSRLPLLSLKIKNFSLKGNEGRYLLFGLITLSIALFGIAALPLIIPLYIASSMFSLVV